MSRVNMFRDVFLEVDDLYLLEAFQISYLPGWVPERELAAVLWAHPSIKGFLVKKCRSIIGFVDSIMAKFGPAVGPQELGACGDKLVQTIADLLVYNKCPEVYDIQEFHNWDFREVTGIATLENNTDGD